MNPLQPKEREGGVEKEEIWLTAQGLKKKLKVKVREGEMAKRDGAEPSEAILSLDS